MKNNKLKPIISAFRQLANKRKFNTSIQKKFTTLSFQLKVIANKLELDEVKHIIKDVSAVNDTAGQGRFVKLMENLIDEIYKIKNKKEFGT